MIGMGSESEEGSEHEEAYYEELDFKGPLKHLFLGSILERWKPRYRLILHGCGKRDVRLILTEHEDPPYSCYRCEYDYEERVLFYGVVVVDGMFDEVYRVEVHDNYLTAVKHYMNLIQWFTRKVRETLKVELRVGDESSMPRSRPPFKVDFEIEDYFATKSIRYMLEDWYWKPRKVLREAYIAPPSVAISLFERREDRGYVIVEYLYPDDCFDDPPIKNVAITDCEYVAYTVFMKKLIEKVLEHEVEIRKELVKHHYDVHTSPGGW